MTIKQLPWLVIKRLFLILLTIVAIVPVFISLGESLNQPQAQAQLQLYQTNLILQASEFPMNFPNKNTENSGSDLTIATNALIGNDPYLTAQKQYQEARQAAQQNLSSLQAQIQKLLSQENEYDQTNITTISVRDNLQQAIREQQKLTNELDLQIGIIMAQRGDIDIALKNWQDLNIKSQQEDSQAVITEMARVLISLWSQPPEISSNTELQIHNNLNSWFRYRSLKQLYQIQSRQDDLLALQKQEQEIALQAIFKLVLIISIPFLGGILGLGVLIFLISQFFIKGERSLLAINSNLSWETPWDAEIIWQVLIVGFFFVGQILLPFLFGIVGFNPSGFSLRLKALYVLVSYLLMAFGGLLVLYFSVKPFFPLPKDWFRFQWISNWSLWGLGGYLVALPLVVIVSLINQQFWQGQGGSNPLLILALQSEDKVALALFFFTAAVAAPVFEEIIFRGFLLASLTRYLPVWGAILASSLVFALAHLSLSEVLPLTILGMVLGFVYTRSRNLLASILLHSLWNSGTLLSLFILGSSNQ